VIVPRPDRLYLPSLQAFPYTRTNSYVEIFRQAVAIDERRRMFRINRWAEPQVYQPNPFDEGSAKPQDIKQVWFAGVHADMIALSERRVSGDRPLQVPVCRDR
jgi:uncharacterized protein (DUF2235 family)